MYFVWKHRNRFLKSFFFLPFFFLFFPLRVSKTDHLSKQLNSSGFSFLIKKFQVSSSYFNFPDTGFHNVHLTSLPIFYFLPFNILMTFTFKFSFLKSLHLSIPVVMEPSQKISGWNRKEHQLIYLPHLLAAVSVLGIKLTLDNEYFISVGLYVTT